MASRRPRQGLLACFALLTALSAAAQLAADTAAGRHIYTAGLGEPAVEVQVGELSFGADRFACVGCHGEQGEGKREGGLDAPPIDWGTLARPLEGYRARPAYGPASFERALTAGLDPRGRTLDQGMPRYRLTSDQARALAAYLRVLSSEQAPGVDDQRARFALPYLASGPYAELAHRLRRAALAAVDLENGLGGAYGRRLELVPVELLESDDAEAIADRLGREEVLAAVGSFVPGRQDRLEAALERLGLPSLFPIAPVGGASPRAAALYPPVARQAEALAGRWRSDGAAPALIVADGSAPSQSAADTLQRAAGWAGAPLRRVDIVSGRIAPAVASIRADRPSAVFYFADSRTLERLLSELDGDKPRLKLYGLIDQLGPVARRSHPGVEVVLASPHVAGARVPMPEPMGAGLERAARRAVHALAESLRGAGRRLSRSRLIEAAADTAADLHQVEIVAFALDGGGVRAGSPHLGASP